MVTSMIVLIDSIQDLVVTIELKMESFIRVLFLHLVPFFCVKGIPTILTTAYKAVNEHWHTASYFRWFKWHCHMSTLSITNCLHGHVTLVFVIPETERINGPKTELPFNELASSGRE
jgi:hypothetical protein